MKLSGWVRLWVVASVVWWAGGAWWLYENFEPHRTYRDRPMPGVPAPSVDLDVQVREQLARSSERYADILEGKLPTPPTPEELRKQAEELREAKTRVVPYPRITLPPPREITSEDWTPWFMALGVVVTAPFGAALALMLMGSVALWVWRGFRPIPK